MFQGELTHKVQDLDGEKLVSTQISIKGIPRLIETNKIEL
jgi:hypothetical protein